MITDAEYDIVLISSQEFDCAGTVYVPFTTSVFYTSTDDVVRIIIGGELLYFNILRCYIFIPSHLNISYTKNSFL